MRTVGDAGTTKPALFRVLNNRRFALFGVFYEGIAHTNIHTSSATVTDIFVKINVIKRH